jgi:hypothetical protein
MSGNNFPAFLHRFFVLVILRQSTPGKTAGAVADKTPETFNWMCRKTQLF